MYIPLKPLFSRHKGIGVQFTDEPTGNLDKKAADEIMELLLAVNRRGNTVLLVTHEQRYADLCGRKIEISDGKI